MTNSNDQLHRFLFDDTDIRGEIVSLEQSLADIFTHQQYPDAIRQLLGEFLAATTLLSSTLKFDGILTLQARGDGDLPLIMAEISHQKKVRAVAQYNSNTALSNRDLQSLIGQGILSIIIDPDKGERYQGIVPLEEPTLAKCLESYFYQSEQLPTKIWLASTGAKASGMMLQRLPQQVASEEQNHEAWETQVHLASTTKTEELLELSHETLLTRLFHEEGVRVFEPETINFGCSCSKERSSKALKQLEKAELLAIIDEEGIVTVDCHFCGFQHRYDRNDIEQLFAPATQH